MYLSIKFLMIVFLLMLKNVNIKNICTCKVVVFSFFQPNCNKVFCFYTQMHLLVLFLSALTGKSRPFFPPQETEKLLKADLICLMGQFKLDLIHQMIVCASISFLLLKYIEF